MNKKQIQLEICRGMLDKSKRIVSIDIDSDAIAIIVDGIIAYYFLKNECIFDESKLMRAKSSENIKELFCKNDSDCLMTVTPFTVEYHGTTLKKLCCENFDCYIKNSLYEKIKGFKIFGYKSTSRFLAVDEFEFPVAIVMPTRVYEDEIKW